MVARLRISTSGIGRLPRIGSRLRRLRGPPSNDPSAARGSRDALQMNAAAPIAPRAMSNEPPRPLSTRSRSRPGRAVRRRASPAGPQGRCRAADYGRGSSTRASPEGRRIGDDVAAASASAAQDARIVTASATRARSCGRARLKWRSLRSHPAPEICARANKAGRSGRFTGRLLSPRPAQAKARCRRRY